MAASTAPALYSVASAPPPEAPSAPAADPVEQIVSLAASIGQLATEKIGSIQAVTLHTKTLAINALIEAARAGSAGAGFSVVANEVKGISTEIGAVATQLEQELVAQATQLEQLGRRIIDELRGERLIGLALNAIEIVDRNLYERTCDVRWWATDKAVVDCATVSDDDSRRYASERLGVILSSYTVYLDIWICDCNGVVVANGSPRKYPRVIGSSVAGESWFTQAMATSSGEEFVAVDVAASTLLDGAATATYSTAIRAEGRTAGPPVGVIAVHFDWGPQAQTVVEGVRLAPEERDRTRVLLLDSRRRVIAASDRQAVLAETFPLQTNGATSGTYRDSQGRTVSFALTPGYETYRGLGWYGCIVQEPGRSALRRV